MTKQSVFPYYTDALRAVSGVEIKKAGRYQNGEDIIYASGDEPRGTQNDIRKGQR